ncbi:MAG: HEAT repeat domain-containing protein [Thermoanaerobaculia bacterium]|nr:HEAT repeat domain-containing protein [Thermoanaerobaculia bacterium]
MSSIPPSGTGNETLALLTAHLSSPETQVLCNVAVALGVLGTPQSAVHLADLAVLQPDPVVRERALAALDGVPREARQAAAERARDVLIESLEKRDDKGRERSSVTRAAQIGYANDVLVTLRHETAVMLPERPLPRWLGWLRTWRGLGLLIGYWGSFGSCAISSSPSSRGRLSGGPSYAPCRRP